VVLGKNSFRSGVTVDMRTSKYAGVALEEGPDRSCFLKGEGDGEKN